jgi:hypothetical protein
MQEVNTRSQCFGILLYIFSAPLQRVVDSQLRVEEEVRRDVVEFGIIRNERNSSDSEPEEPMILIYA